MVPIRMNTQMAFYICICTCIVKTSKTGFLCMCIMIFVFDMEKSLFFNIYNDVAALALPHILVEVYVMLLKIMPPFMCLNLVPKHYHVPNMQGDCIFDPLPERETVLHTVEAS